MFANNYICGKMTEFGDADVVIIGGGVIGCAIAYELARYKLIVYLVEQQPELCFGASGANTGLIHAGFNPKPGSLKAKFNVEGNKLMQEVALELQVPFNRVGAIVLADITGSHSKLTSLIHRGEENGVEGLKIVTGAALRRLEPNINKNISGALFVPSAGIISPYELTIALAENAAMNNVNISLSTRVIDIIEKHDCIQAVETNKGRINTRFVINSAGVFADDIAGLIGLKSFSITPRRGEYLVLDKHFSGLVKHTLFPVPTEISKGIVVTPTVDGNILLGPNAEDINDKQDRSTTVIGQTKVLEAAQRLVPAINASEVIARFAGIRAVPDTNDFIIGTTKIKGFINAAGIASPGLTSAPAIGKHVTRILAKELDKQLIRKTKYLRGRPKPLHLSSESPEEHHKYIQKNSTHGHVICRCEHVTEGEVVDALHRPIPATTLKGVRYRTRTGMGRCQGAFCNQNVIFLLSRELGVPPWKVTLSGKGSELLFKTKKGEQRKKSKSQYKN